MGTTRNPIRCEPWNKGKLVGQKATFKLKDNWALRVRLQMAGRVAQLATAALCTRFHKVVPRLARWLLMTQDRAHSASFRRTQEFLAHMLSLRRADITGAACDLQRHGLIRHHRGDITVLDRAGLETAAGNCHAADRRAYAATVR